ncbi:hypothetical protein BH10CYA1_BH10CYA1_49040 [soil metagenome]
MANRGVLDDNENDKSTKDGASVPSSHHDDMLDHILEDISLDEWDVVPDPQQSIAPPDIVAREIPAQHDPDPSSSASDIQNIQLPDHEWAPTPESPSSLFSFSMMEKFGSVLDAPASEPVASPPVQIAPTQVPVASAPVPIAPASIPAAPTPAPVDPLPEPAPPVAVGPNPFAIKIAPIVETPSSDPLTAAAAAAEPVPATPVVQPIFPPPVASPAPRVSNPNLPAAPNPNAASTRIPALAPTAAMILAQTHSAPIPSPAPTAPPPVVAPAVVASTPATLTPNDAAAAPNQPKRKPAATLIFDTFTKGKIEAAGIDLLDPFNLSPNQAVNPPVATPKQRTTARTLIFKVGMPVDEMARSVQPLSTPTPNPATPGSNPGVSAHPSVGPNLAAAIAAYQAAGPATAAIPASTDAASDAISSVIPAHPGSGGRPIARTMILKSLAKPEPNEQTEAIAAPQDGRPSAETIIAAGHAAEAQAAQVGPAKIAKRSTAPTLVFKAFTLPSPEGNANPAPLKIIRHDSSKLRNLETNVKSLGIAESIAAAKQASLSNDNGKDQRPQWLKLVTANPMLKSQKFRSTALLIILSTALFVCSSLLIKSLYLDGHDYHPTNVTAAALDQRHYKSTDGGKSFDQIDKEKGSVLVNNGKAIHGKLKIVSDADLISLATSPVPKREIWLQKTDAGYVDQDGTILYSAGAPELTIANKIENYVSILSTKYKETKIYPSDAERFERMSPKDFRYTNPFTGHVEQPIVQYKRFAADDASWSDHAKAGHSWPEEPPFKPGAIHCVCLDYCRFFIHGFDRNGQPFYGSVPGVADYVELKDGSNINPHRNEKVTDDKDRTPAVFLISRSPALQTKVALLRQVGLIVTAVIILVALITGGWLMFLRRMKSNKADSVANTTKF